LDTYEDVAEQTHGLRAAAKYRVCGYSWEVGTRRVEMTGNATRRLKPSCINGKSMTTDWGIDMKQRSPPTLSLYGSVL
jgi:hypothetical protein